MDRPVKLKVHQLTLAYGALTALRNVSMDICANRVTALIGPNGCGKTTFLRSINRMNDLISGVKIHGRILYDGTDIYGDCDVIELRKRIGMLFQKANPFPMTVFDNVAYGPRVHGQTKKADLEGIVVESLRRAALWDEVKDRLRAPALGLSGGQQQRLCIARLLAVEPDVILMDEPSSALDPISTSKIEDLMDSLKRRYTVIIVTHNLQQASRISDTTAFFLGGELIEAGDTRDIFFAPQDRRTQDYILGRFG
ncbi:MAG TPA: phosphate ABC transporter ATP-binding protein PstB [Spirochaetia bacterium]|nr:phosphate ABC transporter ATP-binding protein PstB [Spirochaetia bacterium]